MTFPSVLGISRPRPPVRLPPDVRAPKRDSPFRRPGERSRERGAHPPGALARRFEPRRSAIAHAARSVDSRSGTRSPPSHAAAGRSRLTAVSCPLQFQFAEARLDAGRGRRRSEGDPRRTAGGHAARISEGRPRSHGVEGRRAARTDRPRPRNRDRGALGHSHVAR